MKKPAGRHFTLFCCSNFIMAFYSNCFPCSIAFVVTFLRTITMYPSFSCVIFAISPSQNAIYRWYNLIRTCAGECDWLFHWQYTLYATFSASVNIKSRLPIKVYYRICTLKTYQNRNNSWKPECVLSFKHGLAVNFIVSGSG
jgi:hypothetical protein